MHKRWIIGLSSGSSLDGVEAAMVEVEGIGLELRLRLAHHVHQDYPRDLRDLIVRVETAAPDADMPRDGAAALALDTSRRAYYGKNAGLLHRLLGEIFAVAAMKVAELGRLGLQQVQCVGFPGHTVWHDAEGRYASTLSLGMAALVAERTGLTAISDFRARDVAAGGQGFPLTALVDFLLFRRQEEHRVLLHLGELATLVSLPAGGHLRDVIGFQAAPCNILLDGLMRKLTNGREIFDAGGKHAVQGRCIEPVLQQWLAHPALLRRPPKSLARHAFGDEFVAQAVRQAQENHWPMHDLLCTASHFVARAIAAALKRFLPSSPARVLLSGGGIRNGFLWHLLSQQLSGVPLEKTDNHGVPAHMRKAVASAGLAALVMDNVPANLPPVTGAGGARLLGSITPGATTNWARCLAWMARQAVPPHLSAA